MNDIATVGSTLGIHGSRLLLDKLREQTSAKGPMQDQSGPKFEQQQSTAAQKTRTLDIDPETQSVVFRLISESSGSVVVQYPADVQLQLRAYLASSDVGMQPSHSSAKQP